jgi:tetratricopeptide (TPR) repeat protein
LLRQLRRNHRLYELVLDLRITLDDRLRARTSRHPGGAPDITPALAPYRQALAVRALDAMRRLYAFYQTAALTGTGVAVAPAVRLARAATGDGRACQLLADAVRRSPGFAEAWLELGFARLEQGEPAAALEAFERARALPPALERTRFDPDPRLVAAIEGARLLLGRSRPAEALAALDAAPLVPPVPWRFHDLYAALLLQAGRVDEALHAFERCMRGDHIHPSFAALLPRNLAALEATLAAELDAVSAPGLHSAGT